MRITDILMRMVVLASGYGVITILAKNLDNNEFARYSYLISLSAVMSSIITLGQPKRILREIISFQKNEISEWNVLADYKLYALIWPSLIFFISWYWQGQLTFSIFAYSMILALMAYQTNVLIAIGCAKKVILHNNVVRPLLMLLAAVVYIYFNNGRFSVDYLIVVYTVVFFIGMIALQIETKRGSNRQISEIIKSIRKVKRCNLSKSLGNVSGGIKSMSIVLVVSLSTQLPIMVLTWMNYEKQVSQVAVMIKLGLVVVLMSGIVFIKNEKILYESVIRNNKTLAGEIYRIIAWSNFKYSLLMSVILSLVCKLYLEYLGDSFKQLYYPTMLLAGGLTVLQLTGPTEQFLRAKSQTCDLLIVHIISLLLGTIFYITTIDYLDLYGVAIGLLVYFGLSGIIGKLIFLRWRCQIDT